MDDSRPIVELLRVMREWCDDNFDKYKCHGLCGAARGAELCAIISKSEENIFTAYVEKNMPTNFDIAYGWPEFQLQPRLDWLQEQIDLLTNQNQD